MDNIIREYMNSSEIQNLMNIVCSKYQKSIDFDQMESIKLNTLWQCLKKYDDTKGAKFTSFLYQRLTFALKNELKSKRRKEFSVDEIQNNTPEKNTQVNTNELFDGLPKESAKILFQKYINNMTMVEIGKENGYSRETARRKLKNAIKIFKQRNRL